MTSFYLYYSFFFFKLSIAKIAHVLQLLFVAKGCAWISLKNEKHFIPENKLQNIRMEFVAPPRYDSIKKGCVRYAESSHEKENRS